MTGSCWPERARREEPILVGIDGCGVPMLRMDLRQGARIFALLAEGSTEGLARLRGRTITSDGQILDSEQPSKLREPVPSLLQMSNGTRWVRIRVEPGEGGPVESTWLKVQPAQRPQRECLRDAHDQDARQTPPRRRSARPSR